MRGYNRVVLMGNLTRDPVRKQVPSGDAVAELGLASNEVYRSRDGKTVERVCYVDIVAWGRQAETCGEYLHKGSPVLVEGRLQLDRWETKEGQPRSRLRVRADRVQFLGRSDGSRAPSTPHPDGATPGSEDDPMPF